MNEDKKAAALPDLGHVLAYRDVAERHAHCIHAPPTLQLAAGRQEHQPQPAR
jgi:hypothetical protein